MEKETSIKKYHRDVCAVAVENLGNTLQSEKGVGSSVAHRRCLGNIVVVAMRVANLLFVDSGNSAIITKIAGNTFDGEKGEKCVVHRGFLLS